MTGSLTNPTQRTHRRRLCMARGATVLGIGVAAIASCQRFRADTESMYADLDTCEERGGRWDVDRARCAIDVVLADHPQLTDDALPPDAP
ncbi:MULTISPECIES: hypothetical protein [Rhodanobacteraceae]|uniref:hypothetical protein n=1 Tax=Rhodanobacteraceae TaxID=1775411 RepID=UPI000890E8E7|nr:MULTISPECIES: hypothetical protein [Rhodanobacteraceae]SDG03224.1 hypothetical protein SAMN04515659_1935 [Dyella sp. 333MFSha]